MMSRFGTVARRRPDDHAACEAVLFAELPDDAAEARALFARLDLARDADVIDRRHEDEEAPGHGDVRGEPRAFGAQRLLDDLDEDLLPFFQQVFDAAPAAAAGDRGSIASATIGPDDLDRAAARRPWPRPPRPSAAGTPWHRRCVVLVAGFEPLEFLDRVDDLRNVQERVALEPDVDEGRLHPRKHLGHSSFVDVANDAALILAFDENFDDLIVLENRHARVVARRGDDHLLVHGQNSTMGGDLLSPGAYACTSWHRPLPGQPARDDRDQEKRHVPADNRRDDPTNW